MVAADQSGRASSFGNSDSLISRCSDLYFDAMENIKLTKGEVFNIGGGIQNSLSLLELFDILQEQLKIKLNYISTPVRAGDQKVFIADTTKINNLIGWQPKIDKTSGIQKMLEWLDSYN